MQTQTAPTLSVTVLLSSSHQQSADAGGWRDWEDKDAAALWHAASPVQTSGYTTHDGGWTRWAADFTYLCGKHQYLIVSVSVNGSCV